MSANVKWVQFPVHVRNIHKELYLTEFYSDCVLVSSDNQEIKTNRGVLSLASEFFKKLLIDYAATTYEPRILLPDFSYDILKKLICFIYTGSVSLHTDDLSKFIDICNLLCINGMTNISEGIFVEDDNNQAMYTVSLGDPETEITDNEHQASEVGATISAVKNEEILNYEEFEEIQESDDDDEQFQDNDDREYLLNDDIDESNNISYHVVCHGDNIEDDNDIEVKLNRQIDADTVEENTDGYEIEFLPVAYEEDASTKVPDLEIKPRRQQRNYQLDNNLELASAAVMEGQSLRQASKNFGVPKTVLWRKVCRVQTRIQRPLTNMTQGRKLAMMAIQNGETLMQASKLFNVPLSTLHRDKTKMFKEGKLPESLTFRQRRRGNNFKERVIIAAKACLLDGMAQNEASKLYNIPKTTIWRRMKFIKANPTAYSVVLDNVKTEQEEILTDN